MSYSLSNAKIFGETGFFSGELFISSGKIAHPMSVSKRIDCGSNIIVPGLIDLQVNGIDAIDLNRFPDAHPEVSQRLAKVGVTSFLAAIVSQPLDAYPGILRAFSSKKSNCLGLHLEGPHLNPKRAGAHSPECILQECPLGFWVKLLDPAVIKMMTLAPELQGVLELIELLHARKIIASCGHTDATREQLTQAHARGLSFATHLFNAMRPLASREPGPIGYVLGQRELFYSLIVDGVHLAQDTVRLAYNAYPNGLCLVSDISADTLSRLNLERHPEKMVLAGTATLAGSCRTLFEGMREFMSQTSCSLYQAIKAASSNPARVLGLNKGRLAPGFDADFLILSEKGELVATYKDGVQVY